MYDWFGVAFLRDLQTEVWLSRLADVELNINTSSVLFEQLSALHPSFQSSGMASSATTPSTSKICVG